MKIPDKEYLTTSEAAKICKVTRFTVRNWVKQGKLRAITTPGGHQRIPQEAVINLLKKSQPISHNLDSPVSADTEVRCWQAKEVLASGRHRCADCLVFKEQVNRCFLTVKTFGSEKVHCNIDCLNCSFFARHYPRQKRAIEGLRKKAVARLASTVPHADKADIADLLKKGFYVSGKYFAKVKKKLSKPPVKNNRHEKDR